MHLILEKIAKRIYLWFLGGRVIAQVVFTTLIFLIITNLNIDKGLESTKHVNLPWIQISLILTFFTLASFELQNLSNEHAIFAKIYSDMEIKCI